ncbi:MAG: cupin domain-containing protein [Chitinophagales bacterium]|nr:cupin domain-containing protein [Chitinophagales bacterium]
MAIDIFKPIQLGTETFHPVSYTADLFVMDWTMKAGGKVPAHVHIYMDEHFTVTDGEVKFTVNGRAIIKKQGEELLVPKGTVHSITNTTGQTISMRVKYTPCSDAHRMFEILTLLNETSPGSGLNMAKYFYIFPRLGLKEFSAVPSPAAMKVMNLLLTVMGKLAGWDKFVRQLKSAELA